MQRISLRMPKPVFKSLCPVTGKNVRSDLLVPLASLRPALAELVLKEYPQFDGTESISRDVTA